MSCCCHQEDWTAHRGEVLITLTLGDWGTGFMGSIRTAWCLLQDIYIARAEGDLELEEELYWALINIYRSPAVMFEITRKKAE